MTNAEALRLAVITEWIAAKPDRPLTIAIEGVRS
jgi:hypothetical protein